ncbi:MAG: hypothetical protein AAB462_04560 [Patescibacteria group bacterium]
MLRQGGSPEAGSQVGLLQGLRNHRAVLLGTLAGVATFGSMHNAQVASALPTGVGYGDVPEQIADFIGHTPAPAPLDKDYDYDKLNLDRNNKDQIKFYQGCMYGEAGRISHENTTVSRLVGSNIINASVMLSDECMAYAEWKVFATTEYRRGKMANYVESNTTIPAFTSEDDIATDVEYGKVYPMVFYPTDATCKQDPTVKYRVKFSSVRYSLFAKKQYVQETSSNVISC